MYVGGPGGSGEDLRAADRNFLCPEVLLTALGDLWLVGSRALRLIIWLHESIAGCISLSLSRSRSWRSHDGRLFSCGEVGRYTSDRSRYYAGGYADQRRCSKRQVGRKEGIGVSVRGLRQSNHNATHEDVRSYIGEQWGGEREWRISSTRPYHRKPADFPTRYS